MIKKIEEIYFTGGINVVDNKLFGICRLLQEKINELVKRYNELLEEERLEKIIGETIKNYERENEDEFINKHRD